MWTFYEELTFTPLNVGIGIAVTIGTVWFLKKLWDRRSTPPDHPKDTVILYQLPFGRHAPSVSPFPLKLETWLRKNKVPYQNVRAQWTAFHKKTWKVPWMMYNGVDVPDSQQCIEYLQNKLKIPVDPHLTDAERATARAFLKMTEEHLYWCMANLVFMDQVELMDTTLPYTGIRLYLTKFFISHAIKVELQGQGLGRHSHETVRRIGLADLKALSDFLGTKKYLMGDIDSDVDLAVFSMLVMITYNLPGTIFDRYIKDELPNLDAYIARVKEKYWPDWDSNLLTS